MNQMLVDTNVLIRFLIESPATVDDKFKGVFTFFERLESGEISITLPGLVLFETYFVLTSYYAVPRNEAAAKLLELLAFRGIRTDNKIVLTGCLERLISHNIGLVDAYLLSYAESKKITGIYSFDNDLKKHGLELLPVE